MHQALMPAIVTAMAYGTGPRVHWQQYQDVERSAGMDARGAPLEVIGEKE
jgi:hypothetical protein